MPPSSTTTQLRPNPKPTSHQIVHIIFLALLLDLLAFTIPLPLFPRLIDSFVKDEQQAGGAKWSTALEHFSPGSESSPAQGGGGKTTLTLLQYTLSFTRSLRSLLLSFSPTSLSPQHQQQQQQDKWDLTLLGGLLSSLFSFSQFLISPLIGRWSEQYGRRKILLATMLGNLLSAAVWAASAGWGGYVASRLLSGLSESNVHLSLACISDVTSPKERSRALALVGVAFSGAFTLGPSLGAYFASRPLPISTPSRLPLPFPILGVNSIKLNSYAFPALITLVLLTVEAAFLWWKLPETKGWLKEEEQEETGESKEGEKKVNRSQEEREKRLSELQLVHFGFLFFFSGAEFTLTFLTYTLFDYTNAQNGRLLGFIGILSALLQGGYVRRRKSTPSGPLGLAISGIYTCTISLLLLTLLPHLNPLAIASFSSAATFTLYTAAAGLAFVSATVVNSLNALASLETDGGGIDKGSALGKFRSSGQLGRALGPLVATAVYWIWGPSYCYAMGAAGSALVAVKMGALKRRGAAPAEKGKASKDL